MKPDRPDFFFPRSGKGGIRSNGPLVVSPPANGRLSEVQACMTVRSGLMQGLGLQIKGMPQCGISTKGCVVSYRKVEIILIPDESGRVTQFRVPAFLSTLLLLLLTA